MVSKENLKYTYPIITALLFIPSVFSYYNETAFIHSIWYLVISTLGVLLGSALKCNR